MKCGNIAMRIMGAAGVSAVPMAARVVHKVVQEEDKKNYL